MLIEIRDWLNLILEAGIFYYVAREFYYDKEKDDIRKTKRTKTTKKTTTQPSGISVLEETTETTEPTNGGEVK